MDISDIPEIEKKVGAPLIDGSDALATLLKTDTQTNYQVTDPEGITINGKSYKQGDTVALLPKTANLFEGRIAVAGAIDTQKVGPGQKQENYRVLAPNGVNIDGRTIASGDEVMLTAAQAASVPVGSLQLVEKAKLLKPSSLKTTFFTTRTARLAYSQIVQLTKQLLPLVISLKTTRTSNSLRHSIFTSGTAR